MDSFKSVWVLCDLLLITNFGIQGEHWKLPYLEAVNCCLFDKTDIEGIIIYAVKGKIKIKQMKILAPNLKCIC